MGLRNTWRLVIIVIFLTSTCACHALVCNVGQEVQHSNGSLICKTCSPGWYQPLPNVTEGDKCSKKSCTPEARMTNWEDPTMGAVCVCDTTRGSYGEDPQNCRKRYEPCPTNSTLTKTGRCVCIDGHAENASGICVPVATTGVFDKPVPQSQGYFALFALLVVPVAAVVAVVVYRCKKKNYEPVNKDQSNGVQQQVTSCV